MVVDTGNAVMAGPRKMKIDITSDVICPWCLVGVRQLLAAIEKYNLAHVSTPLEPSIRLLPYQLNADLPLVPVSRQESRAQKFGHERAIAMAANLAAKFAQVGLKANPDGLIASSHLAHRLQTYALLTNPENQLPLALDIFTAVHQDGRSPSDIDMLAYAAAKNLIFPSVNRARDWLTGDELELEVQRAYLTARRLGVTGVPFFVFQDKWAVSGAMGVDEFSQLFEEIARREGAHSITPSPTSTAASPHTDQPRRSSHEPASLRSSFDDEHKKGIATSPRSYADDGPGSKGLSAERDVVE